MCAKERGMGVDLTWWVLPAAFILDLILGDPVAFPHPVRLMGKAIEKLEPVFRRIAVHPVLSGGLFALFLIGVTWLISFLITRTAAAVHPFLGGMVQALLIYYCISVRSLEQAAMEVYRALMDKDMGAARNRLQMIVGRQVEHLPEHGVCRGAVETVAENLVDGVVSPLFFAAIGGAPLALAFKMTNTLDSMVGYKNHTYLDFGKISARIDDAVNFIPARLSVLVISLASSLLCRRGKKAFKTALKEGRAHASPNAGFPEAAFAGTLGIWLGGPNLYHGKRVEKPLIGKGLGNASPRHIRKACDLMVLSSLLWIGLLWGAMTSNWY